MKKFLKTLRKDSTKIAVSAVLFAAAMLFEHLIPEILWISTVIYVSALVFAGFDVFYDAVRGILRKDFLDEKFLMTVASIGAMLVGECSEGVAVMLFYLVGESFEHRATRHSRASIRALMDICPDEATLLTDEGEITVDAEDVEIGSTIVIRPGERVPIDCVILSGSADIDTSSMTGEAVPVGARAGDTLDSGVLVLNGLLTCKTLCLLDDSSAKRVLRLVEEASENKSKEEQFITKFSRIYTPLVVIFALLLAIIPPIFRLMSFSESVYRALIFLVISCPCALVISVPMAFFGGIGGAASRGILFKGGNVFSPMARASTFAFDKTGTVTGGSFVISSVEPVGVTDDELLSLAASGEYVSNHPIAASIKAAVNGVKIPSSAEEIAGEGIIATLDGQRIAVGNVLLMRRLGIQDVKEKNGAVYVAREGEYLGMICLSDEIKREAKSALAELKSLGAKETVMLSGDRRENAERVSRLVGIDRCLSELTPEDKYRALGKIMSESEHPVAYVGDGINDAPTLAYADVGIAMGSIGQDSAIESSDVVIMTDNLEKIPEAVKIARKTIAVAKENIIFALSAKGAILILGALGLANMWLAVFADVGVAVIAILNSMRTLRYSKRKMK